MISFTEDQVLAWITPLVWPFLRALALFSSLPLLGTRTVPTRVRIALAALVTLAAQGSLPPMPQVPLDSVAALMLVVQQLLIGISLGFAVRLVFAAVELAGELVGLQMGLNFAGFFDPVSASQTTPTSRFFGAVVGWLFIVINGHLLIIAALVNSFNAFPVSDAPFAFLRQALPQQIQGGAGQLLHLALARLQLALEFSDAFFISPDALRKLERPEPGFEFDQLLLGLLLGRQQGLALRIQALHQAFLGEVGQLGQCPLLQFG